jgi:hypothetical protein
MKKLICAAAAFGLVAGVAATASALDLTVSGQYFIQGNWMESADGSGMNPYNDEAGSQDGWNHTFLFKPTLKVNDKIVVKSDIRFLKDTDYGTIGAQGPSQTGPDLGIKSDGRSIDVHKLWMEYESPIGKMRFGRTPAAAWMGAYLNSPSNGDRIYLFPKMEKPWSSYVFYQKVTENDWFDGMSDSDYDLYEGSIIYTTKETKAALGGDFFNDRTASDTGNPQTSFDRQRYRIKAYLKQTMADWWFEAEASYDFGDWADYDDETLNSDMDVDTWAFQLAAGTSMDNLKITGLYFYASGDDDLTDDDMENALGGAASDGTGDGFNPYYILTGDHTGMLNSDEYADDSLMAAAGVHCIGVLADLKVSDKMTLHGALAYAMAAEEDGVSDAAVALGGSSIDDEYGWEIDLGMSYKLLDNLTYKVEAGYFAAGDFFKDVADNLGTDEDDLYLLSHTLKMTF